MRTRILLAAAVLAALTACTQTSPSSPPASPTVSQTWQQPGNDDLCIWDGTRWAETDDGADCEDDSDGHKVKRPRTTTTKAARTIRTGAGDPQGRRAFGKARRR